MRLSVAKRGGGGEDYVKRRSILQTIEIEGGDEDVKKEVVFGEIRLKPSELRKITKVTQKERR